METQAPKLMIRAELRSTGGEKEHIVIKKIESEIELLEADRKIQYMLVSVEELTTETHGRHLLARYAEL